MKQKVHMLITAMLLCVGPVLACHNPCTIPPLEKSYDRSSDVFYGEVVGRTERPLEDSLDLKVLKRWKGKDVSDMTLTAAANTCDEFGLEAAPGTKVLIFAAPKNSVAEKSGAMTELITGSCHGSLVIKAKDEAAYLDKLQKVSKK